MFKLTVSLPPVSMSGLVALDKRRALKLPDASHLVTASRSQAQLTIDVSEGFARRWFPPTVIHLTVEARFDHLCPGDVRNDDHEYMQWNLEVIEPRLRELAEATWIYEKATG